MPSFAPTLVGSVIFIDGKVGGRKTPVGSGYRGQFFYKGIDCDAIHTFDMEGPIPFNQEVVDHIHLLNPEHRSKLSEGMIFLIREGPHTVGYGRIVQMLERKRQTIAALSLPAASFELLS